MVRYLPSGIENFRTLRASPKTLYIDKTALIAALLEDMDLHPHVFLARPRRFGKSLWLSTLRSLFLGERALFDGTWIGQDGHWDWERRQYPVLLLNMAIRNVHDPRGLENDIRHVIDQQARGQGLTLAATPSPSRMLAALVQTLAEQRDRKVVVLIDEYDTAMTENLECPDILPAMADVMRAFYGVLKDSSDFIRYVFITGITRFAYTGLFSGVNQLMDLSFSPQCSSLLGFTQNEIERHPDLVADLERIARNLGYGYDDLLAALRGYYNGYRFSEEGEAVYNPFSLSHCLATLRKARRGTRWTLKRLPNAWAHSGTPAALFRLWRTGRYLAQFDTVLQAEDPWQSLEEVKYAFAHPDLAALMYQAGYLTIKQDDMTRPARLDFPNEEVRITFRAALEHRHNGQISAWRQADRSRGDVLSVGLRQALREGRKDQLHECIDAFLQDFPYPHHILPPSVKTPDQYAMHYQAILYGAFRMMGLPVQAESPTARGRSDITVEWPHQTVILEFKVSQTAYEAVNQALAKGYADLSARAGKPVVLIGMQFDTALRAVKEAAVWNLGAYDPRAGQWQNEPFRHPLSALRRMEPSARSRIMQEPWGRHARADNAETGSSSAPG